MNRLTALAAVLAALAVPSAASAATLHELPFQPRPDRGGADCLTTAGDGLALVGPSTRRESPVDLLAVTAAGAEARARAPLARTFECPAIAGAPGGAAVVAGVTVSEDFEVALQAHAKDAGGTFGAPVTLGRRGTQPVAAVGAGGHAVVAWVERRSRRTWRIVAARRAPGGDFGAAEPLITWRLDSSDHPDAEIAAAVDGAGGVSLVWARELPSGDADEHVEAATAAPGGPFAVQRLATGVSTDDGPVIAGAADGSVVTAFHIGRTGGLRAFERTPGGAFAAAALPALPDEAQRPWPGDLAVAVRDGGGAVLAWRTGDVDFFRGIEAVTRASSGAFGPVRAVAGPSGPAVQETSGDPFEFAPGYNPFDPFAGAVIDDDEHRLAAALSPEGRVVLAWTAPAGRRPLWAGTAHASTGRLDGTFDGVQALGAPLRDAADVAALFLADGRAAVAWTANAGVAIDGRLHVALEGAATPADPPAPRLTLRAPRRQRLFANQPLRVVASCGGPCDLRASARGPWPTGTGTWTRLRAGSAAVALGPIEGIRRGKPRMVRVTMHATAPGGRRTAVRTLRVRVARRAPLPLRRPLDVTARRRGDVIVVRWRTAAPARRQWFLVAGQAKGVDVEPAFPGTLAYVRGRGHTRFTVRLRPSARFRVPWIVVVATSDDSSRERYVRVRVR